MDFTQKLLNLIFPNTGSSSNQGNSGFSSNQRITPSTNPYTNQAFNKFLDLFEWAYQVRFNFPQQDRIFQEIAKAWNNADKTDNDLMIYCLDLHFTIITNKWDPKYRKQLQDIFVKFFSSVKDNDAIRIMAIVHYSLEEIRVGITGVNVRHQYIPLDFEQAQPNFPQPNNPNFQQQFNPNLPQPNSPMPPQYSNAPDNSVPDYEAAINEANRNAQNAAFRKYKSDLEHQTIMRTFS